MTIDKALNQAPDKKPKIMRFASDTDKMIFDLESDIFSQLQEAFEKEKVKGQTLSDWLKDKPDDYIRRI